MDKFEEWYELDKEVDFYSRKGLAKAVWQHQQSKVEELQNRIDAALARANQACIGNAMFHKQFDDVLAILRGEQALKGESND